MKSILIIIGSAPCAGQDMANMMSLLDGRYAVADYMLIGLDAVEKVRVHVKYFATYHPVDIVPAREKRAAIGGNTDYKIISHQQYASDDDGVNLVDLIIPHEGPSGSSALLGTLAGLQIGYKKIVLCGCPLVGVNDKQSDYAHFQKGWEAKKAALGDCVRSLSGWTKDFLGEPTRGWLHE